jgi:hypothetical protein
LVERTVKRADPFGDFIFADVDQGSCDIIVSIGEQNKRFNGECFWADANGWVAGYGQGEATDQLRRIDGFNPVGACFAACQLNSSIFRHYIGFTPAGDFQKWYSLFDYQSGDSPMGLANPNIPG